MKKTQLITFMLFFAVHSTFANDVFVQQEQQKQIKNTIYKIVYKVNEFSVAKYPSAIMQELVHTEILPLFDFDYMSNNILNNILNNKSKQTLLSRIKQDIATTIMQSLAKARGKIFIPMGVQIINNNIILKLRVKNTIIDLAIHNNKGKWKIFDIALNDKSLINYYKQLVYKNKI